MFRDKSSYSMGKSSKLKLDRGIRDELRRIMRDRGVRPAAERIAARCNAASSWGGYSALHGEHVSWVTAQRTTGDRDRGRRLLTAADGAADV